MIRSMNALSLYIMRPRLVSTYSRSQGCRHSATRFPAAEKSKISGPMLRLQSSGWAAWAPSSRASSVIVALPPVEMFTTASVPCLIRGRNAMKSSALGLGLPSEGLRAWRCSTAAPARAAPSAASAIWSAVTGRCGDIDGGWMEPVGAQVMMTFVDLRMTAPLAPGVAQVFDVQIFLEPVVRALAAHAAHLNAPERRVRRGNQAGVDPDHAAFECARNMRDGLRVLTAQVGGEAELGRVGEADALLDGAEADYARERTEGFLVSEPGVGAHTGEQGWHEYPPF